MPSLPADANRTLTPSDLERPEVAAAARDLRRFARRLWWRGVPFAVNGVLRRRWRIRWNKLWEYARGLAYGDFRPGLRTLDFGGGATIPVFYLAATGGEVLSLDIDRGLSDHTNAVARKMGWRLVGSTHDLTREEAPEGWGLYDRVISFCVLEHLPKDLQRLAIRRLAGLLKPGGLFELTFDFGEDAPVAGAIRSEGEVSELVAASGLAPLGDGRFHDAGERFALDKKYPRRRFTFGSLFLKKDEVRGGAS